MNKTKRKDLKRCSKCRKTKEFGDFRKCNKAKDQLKAYCIPCDNEYQQNNYYAHKERRLKQIKKWQSENPERVRGYKNKTNKINNE